MSDTFTKPESSSNHSSFDDSGDNTDFDREPIQLFGYECTNWDDVHALLQSEHPDLLEKFLFIYRMHVKCLSLIGIS